jgi:Ni/Fe-hydrogenase subunit HybB-like protein
MMDTGSARLRAMKGILWFIIGIAATVAVARFLAGLGAVTNLTDRTPWGLWVGFDVMGGVALAAGGFVIALVVYVLRSERFRPLLRPAVLTAFLGYVAVAVGLLFDLGRPWNIWRPMFFWQHHSALFEVAWCVMLYLTVLALEFAPVPLESSRFHGATKLLKKATLPLVILGIMLSTLHQSSLGTLFLIAPARVHPLWYTPILPLLFFLSAVGLGMGMVIVESKATAWLYHRKPEDATLSRLTKPLGAVLLLYGSVRLIDLLVRGQGAFLFGGWESALFWFEILVSIGLPVLLAFTGLTSRSGKALFFTGFLVVFGFVLHRVNVGGVSGIGLTDSGYFPSWEEIATSLGVVSAAILAFMFIIENFNVYAPEEEEEGEAEAASAPLFTFRPPLATLRSSTLLFVVGASLAFALLPGGMVFGARPEKTPVEGPRRVLAEKVEQEALPHTFLRLALEADQVGGNVREALLLDGNRNGEFAVFDHDAHAERRGGAEACADCHHLNRPADRETSCFECHRDQYLATDIFRHGLHIEAMGGNSGCSECHTDSAAQRTRENVTPCLDCHRDMVGVGKEALIEAPTRSSDFVAPAYLDAMHGLCKKCHDEEDRIAGVEVPTLGLCGTCHTEPTDLKPKRMTGAGKQGTK